MTPSRSRPKNVGVLIPRGARAAQWNAVHGARDGQAAGSKKALGDYENPSPSRSKSGAFATARAISPAGESRCSGLPKGARQYGQPDKGAHLLQSTDRARTRVGSRTASEGLCLATGEAPKIQGLGRVGCHKRIPRLSATGAASSSAT